MKRGPAPNRGLRIAIPVALALGRVMFFVTTLYYPGDFVIAGNGYLGIVRLRLSENIRAPLPEIQRVYARSVTELASFPRGGPVVCELWLYSRYGGLRFFRITVAGLEEIDRSWMVLRKTRPECACPGVAGYGDLLKSGPAGGSASAAPDAAHADAVTGDPPGRIRRWLTKRNAAMRATGITNFLDPVILKLLSDAVKPDEIMKRSAGKNPAGSPGTPNHG